MGGSNPVFRRQALQLTGTVATTALVAGCLSSDGENGRPDSGDDNAETNEPESSSDTEQTNTESDTTTDPAAWTDVEEIVLSATTSSWEGIEPKMIEGEENPTLVLTEGNEYAITWINADGQTHNLEIWDENESVVGGYATELMDQQTERQTLEFVAASEMHEYACRVHADWGKRADLEIETSE